MRSLAAILSAILLSSCAGGAGEPDSNDHDHDFDGNFALTANFGGYLVLPESRYYEPGEADIALSIIGRQGEVHTDFDLYHEELMHLVLVSHDMESYLHVHPEMNEDGVWSATVDLDREGPWRVVADFVPSGDSHMELGFDIQVGTGVYEQVPAPASDIRVDQQGPYTATLQGETAHERAMPLRLSLTRDGQPVDSSSVTEWMGADAHMVGFMTHPDEPVGDLDGLNAYIHMHPNSSFRDGNLTFTAPPTPHGWWQIFVEVILDGEKRTFRFQVWAP